MSEKIKVIAFKHLEELEEKDGLSHIEINVIEIENDLNVFQNFVKGYIDYFQIAYNQTTGRSLDFICNDEGLLDGMKPTIYYTFKKGIYIVPEDDTEVLVGNLLFVANDREGNTTGLTDEEINNYLNYFMTTKNIIMNPNQMFVSTL